MHRAATPAAWLAVALVVASSVASGGTVLAATPGEDSGVTVSGRVDGLVPGRPGRLTLTVHNATGQRVTVTALDARPTVARGCRTTDLRVTRWSGRLTIGPGQTADQDLTATAGTGCASARWELAYTADLRS